MTMAGIAVEESDWQGLEPTVTQWNDQEVRRKVAFDV